MMGHAWTPVQKRLSTSASVLTAESEKTARVGAVSKQRKPGWGGKGGVTESENTGRGGVNALFLP